jgi:hypothetical protein
MKGDEVDRLLDDALASYTLIEPRIGFNARVMARVEAEAKVPRWPWLRWAVGVLALAGLATVVVTWKNMTPASRPVEMSMTKPLPMARVEHPVEVSRVAQRAPRRAGLTSEERALVEFAHAAPQAAREMALPDKPLEIEAINIPPVQIDGIEIGEMK